MAGEQWHLDRKVPISLILTIIVQTFVFGWFLRGLSADITSVSARTTTLEQEFRLRREVVDSNKTGIAVINQNLLSIQSSLDRIERRLDNEKPAAD